jgi:hypothetical protein
MKPPTMTDAPLGIIATASSTETDFMMKTPVGVRATAVYVLRKFRMRETAGLDLHQGAELGSRPDLQRCRLGCANSAAL